MLSDTKGRDCDAHQGVHQEARLLHRRRRQRRLHDSGGRRGCRHRRQGGPTGESGGRLFH
ncbi:hypothetical protein BN1708_019837 [Verticillium longisporum]|uniref:Uncharacterized protein n=1 Tax=Verticillium longisporum TaxID=100787 RepID=A0A0G4MNI2_VERLO|nr:hypothetical protein BN1708_019837 [Verticillium longisporum]